MTKRILSFALVFCICICFLSACGGTKTEAPTVAVPKTEAPKAVPPASPSATPKPTPILTPEPTPDVTKVVFREEATMRRCNSDSINSCAFSAGVAWVKFQQDTNNETRLGIMNTKGEIIFLLDKSDYTGKIDDVITTPFMNGLSVVGDKIINKNGQFVFSPSDYDDMSVIGQADDGTIFLLRHTDASFSSNSSNYIYIYDPEKGPVETGVEIDDSSERYMNPSTSIYQLAEGFYCFNAGHGYYMNLKNGSWIGTYSSHKAYRAQSKDYVCVGLNPYYLIPKKELVKAASIDDIEEMCDSDSAVYIFDGSGTAQGEGLLEGSIIPVNYNGKIYDYKLSVTDWKISNYKKNSCLIRREGNTTSGYTGYRYIDYKIIDYSRETIFSYPEFPQGVSYEKVLGFNGGYSAICLKGVDKKQYVTIVDEQGTIQYEPVVFSNAFCTCNGYVFGWEGKNLTIIDPTGKIKAVGDKLPGLETACSSTRYDNKMGTFRYIAINEGYIYWAADYDTPVVFSVDGRIIEGVQINYNINSELLYTGEDGNYHIASEAEWKAPFVIPVTDTPVVDDPETTSNNETEYITLNSFSIKGKWKNIGTYTFGQVQEGAIVVFDGKNCNVYSPKDTYAFYKKGNDYMLDCTSFLFSETLSFTVKLIDNDHMDIFTGNGILELSRVK